MGAGISTLTPLQGAEVVRKIKEQYDLCESSNMSPEEKQRILTKKYKEVVHHVTFSPLKVVTSNAKRLNRGISKDELGVSKSGKHRRRSFEPESKPTKSTSTQGLKQEEKKSGGPQSLLESQSSILLVKETVLESTSTQGEIIDSIVIFVNSN
jgi:hypothetical protein